MLGMFDKTLSKTLLALECQNSLKTEVNTIFEHFWDFS